MNTRGFALGLLVLLLSPLGAAAQTFVTTMTPSAEAPPVVNNGSGVAAVTVRGTSVTFSIYVTGISTPTLAHIHKAPAGTSGSVVIDFMKPVFTNGYATGTVTAAQEVVSDLLANPSSYYVNVHTAEFPSGALRGQLGSAVQPTSTFLTTLAGAAESPMPGSVDGGGAAQVTISGTTVTYTILVQGISTPTAAHIHRGIAGVAGPVVVGFNPTFSNGLATGIVTTTPQLAAEILANPAGFYVNVHTPEFPGGAMRGQLDPAPPVARYVPTVVNSPGLNGAVYVSDLRIVNPGGSTAFVTVDYFAASGGLGGPTATTIVAVPSGGQGVVDNVLNTLFSASGSGALRLTSTAPVVISSRVLNDQRPMNAGTTGLSVPVLSLDEAPINGTLPLLASAPPSDVIARIGFRTNLGYFNPTASTVKVTFRARKNDGTVLGTNDVTVAGYARVQLPIFDILSSVGTPERNLTDFYVTYSADGPLFVYATVADNKTGDGFFIAGQNPR
ncbi:MAG TPA: CHRD domain-containing protein [Thermoanaerobaculia bacterium]|nr:CHRD domain-containing protein [Thermoanaerobaculia bacterium]